MKRNLISALCFFCFINFSFSQAPDIEWQNTIGGNSYDDLRCAYPTADGGYILGGTTSSAISGDKTEANNGSEDYWIVKLDSSGSIEWQNVIGGNSYDYLRAIQQTSDGGYIVGGFSQSGHSGDKTDGNNGIYDYWILKLNAAGIIEWQNGLGGNSNDYLESVQQTADGGFIVGGWSDSGISGDKSESGLGNYDYWILKLNSGGIPEWQNTIGGNSDDRIKSLQQTVDGGYIVGGFSNSGISGDKTEGNLGATSTSDYWVIKLNTSGSIEWQNTIGGNADDFLYSVRETTDGGFVLGGWSESGLSDDKSEPNYGSQDYWVVKLNATGIIQWQNTISGNGSDVGTFVEQTTDGGYILGGYSNGSSGDDKSEPNYDGSQDYWVLKLTNSGEVEWDKTMGGNSDEELYSIRQTGDGGYILGGISFSGLSGNKTEANLGVAGSDDFWVVKLYPDVCAPVTEICNSQDDNCNGLVDEGVFETISINASGPTTFCTGNAVLLTSLYSGTYIKWKKDGTNIPGATSSTYSATTTGTYSAQTSSDCDTEISNEIYVHVNKKPNAFIYADGPTSFCAGGSVTLIANTGGGLSYQWYKGASTIAGATNINYVATTTGNYKCLVTKIVSGCNKQSNAIAVAVTCKEENEISINEQFIIYPNPSSENIIITLSSIILTTHYSPLTITDISGKTIAQYQLISHETEIDISNYPSGIYFVKMIIDDKQLTEKFIKQ